MAVDWSGTLPAASSLAASGPAAVPVAGSSVMPTAGLKNLAYTTAPAASTGSGCTGKALGAHLPQRRHQSGWVRRSSVNRPAVTRRDQQVTGTGGNLRILLQQQIPLAWAQAGSQPGAVTGHGTEVRRRLIHPQPEASGRPGGHQRGIPRGSQPGGRRPALPLNPPGEAAALLLRAPVTATAAPASRGATS